MPRCNTPNVYTRRRQGWPHRESGSVSDGRPAAVFWGRRPSSPSVCSMPIRATSAPSYSVWAPAPPTRDGETISVSTAAHVTSEGELANALPALTGVIQQIPPDVLQSSESRTGSRCTSALVRASSWSGHRGRSRFTSSKCAPLSRASAAEVRGRGDV